MTQGRDGIAASADIGQAEGGTVICGILAVKGR